MTRPISADDGQGVGGQGNDGQGGDGQSGGGVAGGGGPKRPHKEPLPKFDTIFKGEQVRDSEQGIAKGVQIEMTQEG